MKNLASLFVVFFMTLQVHASTCIGEIIHRSYQFAEQMKRHTFQSISELLGKKKGIGIQLVTTLGVPVVELFYPDKTEIQPIHIRSHEKERKKLQDLETLQEKKSLSFNQLSELLRLLAQSRFWEDAPEQQESHYEHPQYLQKVPGILTAGCTSSKEAGVSKEEKETSDGLYKEIVRNLSSYTYYNKDNSEEVSKVLLKMQQNCILFSPNVILRSHPRECDLRRPRSKYEGYTLLQALVMIEKLEIAKRLIVMGGDIYLPIAPLGDLTLLEWAERENRPQLVEFIIENLPDQTRLNQLRLFQLFKWAMLKKHEILIDFLLNKSENGKLEILRDTQIFSEAMILGNVKVVRFFIERTRNIRTIVPFSALHYAGYTPIQWAVVREDPKTVELLVQNGLDPNMEILGEPLRYSGYSLLEWAIAKGYVYLIRLLIQRGASLDPFVKSFLPLNSWDGYSALINILSSDFAISLIENSDRMGPQIRGRLYEVLIKWAIMNRDSAITRMLLEKKISPNMKVGKYPQLGPEYEGCTLLQLAVLLEDFTTVQVLIEHEAKLYPKELIDGIKFFDIIMALKNQDLKIFLLQHIGPQTKINRATGYLALPGIPV